MFDFENAGGMLFDCDGTLLDTLDAWEEAERDLFAQAGPLTPEQQDDIHSAPIEQAAAIFHGQYGVGDSARAVLDHLDGRLLPYYRNEAAALPGAVDFVRRASEHAPCVVVSSSPRRYLEAGLGRAGILGCFAELVTTDETGCSKRDPAIYERAVACLGVPPSAVWAIDDAPYAIAAMHAFGLRTVCVGPRDSAHADINIASFADLLGK